MRRTLRRIARRFVGPAVGVWYHPSFRLPLPSAQYAPGMSARRADDVLTWALDTGVVSEREIHEAPELPWDAARRVHTPAYLDTLDQPGTVASILGLDPEIVSVDALLELWRRGCGATVEASRWARRHQGRAVCLLGGFHHATPDRGAGFCALNDIAIAVAVARDEGVEGTIAILDLDAHPSDGVVACLGDDPKVTVLSLSGGSAWTVPEASRARVVDARVPPGCATGPYLQAVDELLREVPRDTVLAFHLAGGDPLEGDRLGDLAVSEAGLRVRDRRVLSRLSRIPTVILPGGGYLERSWRVLAGTLAEATGLRTAVAPDYDPLTRRTRDVMRRLDPHALGASDAFITEEELLGSMGVPSPTAEPRFLGYYTRHGLEHALTAYGYLPTLRRLGFQDLRLQIEVGSGPDRMLVTAAVRGKREALVDLAASIRKVDRWRTLFIEWLELRDPRVPFTTSRPRLPGQQQPGLGLADETGYLLVRASDRLNLAGVSHVPAHYHVAWMSRGRFVLVDPEARGRFAALVRYLDGVPLLEASRLLDGPGIPTEDGERIRWEPSLMVAPSDPDLAEWLRSGDARAKVIEEGLSERLLPRSAVLP